MTDLNLQYKPEEPEKESLTYEQKIGVKVPLHIITDKEQDDIRVALYSYLYIRKGRDNILYTSISLIAKWMNKRENRNTGGINLRLLETLKYFKDEGYIFYDESELDGSKPNIWKRIIEIKVSYEKLKLRTKTNYAFIYLDELHSILNFKNENKKDAYVNNTNILLVFAYLRLKIRINKQMYADESLNCIEAYSCYMKDIYDSIGLHYRMVLDCLRILKYKLELVYYKRIEPERVKVVDGVKSNLVVFTNTYKRDSEGLVASGEEYYLNEYRKKVEWLQSMNLA